MSKPDPEGATVAFERAQAQAMLRRTRVDLPTQLRYSLM